MNPDELRAAADRATGIVTPGTEVRADDLRVVITAARRLADVIEWAASVPQAEKYPTFTAGWEEAALHVLQIARGETNERESNAAR